MGYTKTQVDQIIDKAQGSDAGPEIILDRGRVAGRPVDVLNFPVTVADPQIELAHGHFAYGFNLNGKVEPDSFEDPDSHELGVDNQLWRAIGCFKTYDVTLPVVPFYEHITWDTAMDAMPAWVLSVTGDDLSKDGAVTVVFDRALNVLIRNTLGGALSGTTFIIDPSPQSHSVLKGQIKGGVLTVDSGNLTLIGESPILQVLRLSDAHVRFSMKSDGTLSGIVGGYEPWIDFYYFIAVGTEVDSQVNAAGVYYALKRLADGAPDPKTGQNMAISSAFWMDAVPAFLEKADVKGAVHTVSPVR
jgi:hypothetical protein